MKVYGDVLVIICGLIGLIASIYLLTTGVGNDKIIGLLLIVANTCSIISTLKR